MKSFDQLLSTSLKSRIHVSCGPCEKCCTSDVSHSPRVKVNGRILNRATPADVKNAILAFR